MLSNISLAVTTKSLEAVNSFGDVVFVIVIFEASRSVSYLTEE